MKFKELLFEAFNEKDFNKVSTLVGRLLAKHLGMKIYRFGGPNGVYQAKKLGGSGDFIGALFFTDKGFDFRINYEKTRSSSIRITSVDYWKGKWWEGRTPDSTLRLPSHFNIVMTVNAIKNFLNKPKEKVIVPLEESLESLTEARGKISPKILKKRYMDLYYALKSAIEEKKDFIDSKCKIDNDGTIYATRPAINATKSEYGVKIPSTVWEMKAARGLFKLPAPENIEAKTETPSKETKAKIDSRLEKIWKAEVENIEENIAYKKFEKILRPAILSVIQGTSRHLLIYGKAGIGKTWTVLDVFKERGLKENEDFFYKREGLSPMALYRTLFKYRNDIVVFDDSDKMFMDPNSINILKNALDTTSQKVGYGASKGTNLIDVSFMDSAERREIEAEADDEIHSGNELEATLPNEFEFNGSLIVLTNLDKKAIDKSGALASRVEAYDMTVDDIEVLEYMAWLIDKLQPEIPVELSREEKLKVWDVYMDAIFNKSKGNAEPSIRSFVICLGIYASKLPGWKERIYLNVANVLV